MSDYWEKRYAAGGNSGNGSIGELRDWKWGIIKKYVDPIHDVIDVGCGDMSFWENERVPNGYIGIDGSYSVIQKNREKYPNATFHYGNAEFAIHDTAPVVFCFDMLFHVMEDTEYSEILYNLGKYTTEILFIYTWISNPIKKFYFFSADRDEYERFHDPNEMCRILKSLGFFHPVVFTSKLDAVGAMFVFRKKP